MTRTVALLSDLHGDLDALEQVSAAAAEAGASELWFLGDAVGYADPQAQLDTLWEISQRCSIVLAGNHEGALGNRLRVGDFANAAQALVRASLALDEHPHGAELYRLCASLPPQRLLGPVYLVHGAPFDPWWGFVGPDNGLEALRALPGGVRLCVCGHTHTPYAIWELADGRIMATDQRDELKQGLDLAHVRLALCVIGAAGCLGHEDRTPEWALLQLDKQGLPVRFQWRS